MGEVVDVTTRPSLLDRTTYRWIAAGVESLALPRRDARTVSCAHCHQNAKIYAVPRLDVGGIGQSWICE